MNVNLKRNKEAGFTLVELLIAVTIIGILAGFSIPAYQDYTRRGFRTDAQQFMLDIASGEERFLLDNRNYTSTIGSGGLGLTTPSRLSSRYTFAVSVGSSPLSYAITATATGTQLSDGNLTLSSDGSKTPLDKWQ